MTAQYETNYRELNWLSIDQNQRNYIYRFTEPVTDDSLRRLASLPADQQHLARGFDTTGVQGSSVVVSPSPSSSIPNVQTGD